MRRLEEHFANDIRSALTQRGGGAIWVLLGAIAVLFGSAVAWASQAVLEEVTTGDGRVIASSQMQIVQSLEGGIVAEILVGEGDPVTLGDPLIVIDDTQAAGDLGEITQRFETLSVRAKRLRAEIAGEDLVVGGDRFSAVTIEIETALLASRRAARDQELAVIRQQIVQAHAEQAEIVARLDGTRDTVALLEREVAILADLAQRRAAPEIDLLRLQRQLAAERRDLASLEAALPRTEAAISEAQAREDAIEAGFLAKANEDLAQTLADLAVIAEQLAKAEDRLARTALRAPADGIVNALAVTTIGAVIQSGERVAEIVPIGDELLIEARIRPQDVAFLHPGQAASVKLTAYNFTTFGALDGFVERISADTLTDSEGNTFYRAIIRTERNFLGTEAEPLPIIPGMIAQADILTGEKTVLDYILNPIARAREQALRER
ncbi:MAG: HlyD family type I secretion periplasmic adaptor subunit [Pseudomonadota bacterium]